MLKTKQTAIYLHNDQCYAIVVCGERAEKCDGLTERNIGDFIADLQEANYHVLLYRIEGLPKGYPPITREK